LAPILGLESELGFAYVGRYGSTLHSGDGKKLKDLSAQTRRGTDDLVEDATAGYVDELLQALEMLNDRYDDLKSGKVKPIDCEEAFARLRANTEAQRKRRA
jgi:hypothetical protein